MLECAVLGSVVKIYIAKFSVALRTPTPAHCSHFNPDSQNAWDSPKNIVFFQLQIITSHVMRASGVEPEPAAWKAAILTYSIVRVI